MLGSDKPPEQSPLAAFQSMPIPFWKTWSFFRSRDFYVFSINLFMMEVKCWVMFFHICVSWAVGRTGGALAINMEKPFRNEPTGNARGGSSSQNIEILLAASLRVRHVNVMHRFSGTIWLLFTYGRSVHGVSREYMCLRCLDPKYCSNNRRYMWTQTEKHHKERRSVYYYKNSISEKTKYGAVQYNDKHLAHILFIFFYYRHRRSRKINVRVIWRLTLTRICICAGGQICVISKNISPHCDIQPFTHKQTINKALLSTNGFLTLDTVCRGLHHVTTILSEQATTT